MIDELEDNGVTAKHLKEMLETNGLEVTKITPGRLLHKAADGMLFGIIGPCPECKNKGTLRWNGK